MPRKTYYENIYDWVKSEKGTCFYCYQDKPITIALIGEKGICQECIDTFKIGHFGADRHVIGHLCNATTHKKAVAWIRKHGGKLTDTGDSMETEFGKWYFYLGTSTNGEEQNRVEICEDGAIHIIY